MKRILVLVGIVGAAIAVFMRRKKSHTDANAEDNSSE